MSSYRQLKLELMQASPHCHWCGILVKDYGRVPDGEPNPHDQATIDHLKSRFFRKKGESVPKVLACAKCNQRRARAEDRVMRALGLIKEGSPRL